MRDRFLNVEASCNCAIAENAIEKHSERHARQRAVRLLNGVFYDGQIIIGAHYRRDVKRVTSIISPSVADRCKMTRD